MERRKFLTILSTTVPLSVAGCLGGGNDGGSGSPETTATPTTDTTSETTPKTTTADTATADDGPLRVGDQVELSGGKAISVDQMDSSISVLTKADRGATVQAEDGAYYVRVTFNGHGITEYESFVTENVSLVVEEQEYGDPVFTYTSGFNTFTAAYRVPADLIPYTGRVNLETDDVSVAWEFNAGNIESITQAVDYSVAGVSVPDATARGSPFELEITVENGGDPMTFLAQVFGTMKGPIRVREAVPGDDAKTFTVKGKAPATTEEDEFEVTLDWGADSVSKTIQFE